MLELGNIVKTINWILITCLYQQRKSGATISQHFLS